MHGLDLGPGNNYHDKNDDLAVIIPELHKDVDMRYDVGWLRRARWGGGVHFSVSLSVPLFPLLSHSLCVCACVRMCV